MELSRKSITVTVSIRAKKTKKKKKKKPFLHKTELSALAILAVVVCSYVTEINVEGIEIKDEEKHIGEKNCAIPAR